MASLGALLWEGCVPVEFCMAPAEVTALHAPRSFFALVPRLSFLVSHTREAIEHFREAAPPMASAASIWFAASVGDGDAGDEVPLPWHVPFGLLRDLVGRRADLPWRITVHFLGFPAEQLLPCENERSVEQHFMHSLKQATFLRTGSTKAIMALPEAQQNQIWASVTSNDYAGYQAAMQDVLALDADPAEMRHLPLRVHLDTSAPIQMPIAPLQKGAEQTLGGVLRYLLPDLFPSLPESSTPSDGDPSNSESSVVLKTTRQVMVHGIVVPLDVSIVALYRSFAYADGFLYISVIEVDENEVYP